MVKITEKGQVTLPKRIRDQLDLKPGDEIDFEIISKKNRQLRVKKAPSLSGLFGVLETDKTFPGKEEIRQHVGNDLGERSNRESDS